MLLLYVLAATILNSLVALIGAFSLLLRRNVFDKFIFSMIAFASGALLAGAFFHLLAESMEQLNSNAFYLLMLGFIFFFFLEKILRWRHCHNVKCKIHAFTYLSLLGDAVHNFIDGVVIGASFLVSLHFGFITTLLIILHEIPQELGDFAVLVYGGWKKHKALLANFLVQLTCIVGALIVFFVHTTTFIYVLLAFSAGGFLYIASSDLIPELHKQEGIRTWLSFLWFLFGIALLLCFKLFLH